MACKGMRAQTKPYNTTGEMNSMLVLLPAHTPSVNLLRPEQALTLPIAVKTAPGPYLRLLPQVGQEVG